VISCLVRRSCWYCHWETWHSLCLKWV